MRNSCPASNRLSLKTHRALSGASAITLLLVVIVLALGGGVYYWWQHRPVAQVSTTSTATAPVEPAATVTPPVPVQPSIRYPMNSDADADKLNTPLPALHDADTYVTAALTELLGRKDVLTFIETTGFVRRVVATVDNLARSHAAPALWPVMPTPGRFITMQASDHATQLINPDNGLRYSPLVQFIESVNTQQAIKLYTRLYPLFQQAYEELGYPGHYFNDRLIAVIDNLLATPKQDQPLPVQLTEVKGPIPSERPWVRYEFVQPELEALSAGQKMLLRSGPVNQRRLSAKLIEIRKALINRVPGKS